MWQVIIFLAKIPAPLKFEVRLELLFSKHKLSPGWKWVFLEERARWQAACPAWGLLSAWLRLDRSWERREEAACECQAPSASPLLPAFPSSKASWGFLDRKQACPVYTMFAVACPGTGSSKSRCPRVADVPCHVLLEQIKQCWKIAGQAPPRVNPPSDIRLCQTRCWEGVVVCWSVDLCFEGSAWFLFETWERRKEEDYLPFSFMAGVFSSFTGIFGIIHTFSLQPYHLKTQAYASELSSVSGDDKVMGCSHDPSSIYPSSSWFLIWVPRS